MVIIENRGLKWPVFLLLFGIFLLPGLVIAQEGIKKIGSDPLQNKQPLDTAKIQELFRQYNSLRGSNPDSAIIVSRQAIEMAEDAGYEIGKALGFKNIGIIHFYRGEYDDALDYFNRSLRVYEKEADTAGISNVQNNIGSVYQSIGDNPRALDYIIKSIRNAEIVKDTVRLATAYLNIGTVYSNDKNTYSEAVESFERSIEMFEKLGDIYAVAVVNINYGELYLEQNEPLKALPVLNAALEGFERVGADVSPPLNRIGQAYEKSAQYDKASKFYMDALVKAEELGNISEETKAYLGLGNTFLKTRNYSMAVENFRKGLELAEKTKVLYDQREAYLGLSNSYSGQNDFRNALEAQQNYAQIQDSIRSEGYENQMGNLRVQFGLENAEKEIELLNAKNQLNQLQIEEDARAKRSLTIILFLFLAIIAGFIFQYFFIKRTNKRLAFERNRSDQILLNILPEEVAEELKQKGFTEAKEFDNITVMFTDFKGFSLIAERVSAEKLVRSVDYYFKKFDEITERHNLEKIKTIGDAYMCAGGLPTPNQTHARDAFEAALEILKFVKETELNPPKDIYPFQIRIGLSSGPVVAGVVGTKKFAYDIWGNTVNIASRMESGSVEGRINVSENIYRELKDDFEFTYRGELQVKSQTFKMYFAEIPEEVPA